MKNKQFDTEKIFVSSNWNMFRFRKDNREVKSGNVLDIKKSIQKMGQVLPIVVNKKYEIIDGQHRYTACKDLNVPIRYTFGVDLTTEDIAELQSVSKKWMVQDYLNTYLTTNKPGYDKYKEFKDMFPEFSHSIILTMLSNGDGRNQKLEECFKSGKIQINDFKASVKLGEFIKKFAPYVTTFRRSFILALIKIKFTPDFEEERLLRKMPMKCKLIKDFADHRDFISVFQEIYNWRESKKVYFDR